MTIEKSVPIAVLKAWYNLLRTINLKVEVSDDAVNETPHFPCL
jgi:hypothetical protein